MSAQLRPLLIANLKMFWRSLDTVWVAIVSPMLLLGIVGLARHLQFAFTHSTGGVAFLSFSAIGFAAFLGAHLNQDGIVGAASGYRAQGVLKRIAVTPVSARTFIAGQVLIRLAVALLQTVVLVGFAIVLGASIAYTIDLAWILPVAATALLTGTSSQANVAWSLMCAPSSFAATSTVMLCTTPRPTRARTWAVMNVREEIGVAARGLSTPWAR